MTQRHEPYSVEAEQAILCAVLNGGGEAADEAFDLVQPEEFWKQAHATLLGGMRHLHAEGKPIDAVQLRDELERTRKLEAVGGVEYLSYLLDVVPSAANLAYHCAIVRARALERRVIAAGERITRAAWTREAVGEQLTALAENELFTATDRTQVRSAIVASDLMLRLHGVIEQRMEARPDVIGIGTGLTELDRLTGGWRDGNLILVAGRPGEGKSSLALHFAQHAAVACGIPTALYSLEMGADECGMRLIAAESLVDLWSIERGRIDSHEAAAIFRATSRIGMAPLYIDDIGERTVGSLRASARRLHRKQDVRLVVVDYGQLLSGDERAENRTQEMSAVSRGLKGLAKQLKTPVLVCCQLNRAKEGRADDSRPRLSDLRETGQWEQDAHVVLFPWKNPELAEGMRTIIVGKQRNGPTGDVNVVWDRKTGRWEDVQQRVAVA
jgi:replicative DNA helicase